MLQDIAPHIYRNQMSWKAPDADDFVLCYRGRTLYCKVEDRNLILPRVKDVAADALQYAFSIDERADYLLSDAEFGRKGRLFLLRYRKAPQPRPWARAHGGGSGGEPVSLVLEPAVLRPVRQAHGKEQD